MAKKEEKSFMDVKDETKNFDKKDIESGKGMAIISYLGFLSLIPYLFIPVFILICILRFPIQPNPFK